MRVNINRNKVCYKPLNRQTITVYCRWSPHDADFVLIKRRVLTNAVYRAEGSSLIRTTGVILRDSVTVQCFEEPGIKYITANEWNNLPESELDGFWTADYTKPGTATIIVPYECGYEFIGGANIAATDEENSFVADRTVCAKRISALPEDNLRGVYGRHILLRV